ncbi:response regulator transcription factor [Micromonospora haikouensis]|uniref:response regulator transcription factor n=1 Tax=Micromonospora haikouensis TaxID=686309 RepID=UPI0037B578A1
MPRRTHTPARPLRPARVTTRFRRLAPVLLLAATEERVARLAARGRTNRVIADTLFISPKTVEANLARAYRKLGISSRAELGAVLGRPASGSGAVPVAGDR